MSALRNISVYALVIFITQSVLMIFSNLTFLETKQSRVQHVLEIQRVLGVHIRKSFVSILNCAVVQICKIGYFSMFEGSFTDFSALYTVLKLEKIVSGVLEQ